MVMMIPPEAHPLAPQQNQVPNNPNAQNVARENNQALYQQDPFETPTQSPLLQRAQITDYAGTRIGQGGFRTKPVSYTQDPFEQQLADKQQQDQGVFTDQDFQEEYSQYFPEPDNEPPPQTDAPTTPSVDYDPETGLTQDNISGVYSLTEDELPQYGIDIHAPNVGDAPEGIISGWNDADGDGYDDDGHAYGTHGAVNVQTAAGEQSIEDVLADPSAGLPEQNWYDPVLDVGTQALGYVEDAAQPQTQTTAWGDEITTSPGAAIGAALPPGFGALAALGGGISAANLDNIYENYGEYDTGDGFGVIPADTIPSVNTPLAVSEGFIPGTTVVSGNTDLALQQNPYLDVDGDGQLTVPELQAWMDGSSEGIAQKQDYDDNAEAAQVYYDQQVAQAESEGGGAFVGGSPVLDNNGNAVLDSSGQVVTSGGEWTVFEPPAPPPPPPPPPEPDPPPPPPPAPEPQYDSQIVQQETQATQAAYEQEAYGGSSGTQSGQYYDSGHDWSAPTPPASNNDDGGGGGDSCFARGTKFRMQDGSLKEIQDIQVGDIMDEGGRVYGVLTGDGFLEDWYEYDGVHVTGSHFVFDYGKWIPVEDSPNAVYLKKQHANWFCVLNYNHRMLSENGTLFTDFDAVDSVNKELEVRLNEKAS